MSTKIFLSVVFVAIGLASLRCVMVVAPEKVLTTTESYKMLRVSNIERATKDMDCFSSLHSSR